MEGVHDKVVVRRFFEGDLRPQFQKSHLQGNDDQLVMRHTTPYKVFIIRWLWGGFLRVTYDPIED